MAMYLGSNKVEIGVASGGGGSSDFSTATVTVTVASAQRVSVANLEDGVASYGGYPFSDNDTQTLTVILYKGSAGFSAESGMLTATGDIELPPLPLPACTIHGDGTITIS